MRVSIRQLKRIIREAAQPADAGEALSNAETELTKLEEPLQGAIDALRDACNVMDSSFDEGHVDQITSLTVELDEIKETIASASYLLSQLARERGEV